MTYREFKLIKSELDNKVTELSEKLNSFPKGEFGLTPDEIKFSSEFRALKAEFNVVFQKLQQLNEFGVKAFKKEMKEERKAKSRSVDFVYDDFFIKMEKNANEYAENNSGFDDNDIPF